ncbi:serine hydrolase domain-containing protein [Candidatus Hydrogenedentota bacterium]
MFTSCAAFPPSKSIVTRDRVLEPSTEALAGIDGELVEAAIHEDVETGLFPCAVYLVARHGRIAAYDALGYADPEEKTPMKQDSIIQIGSVTKPITATGLMILWDDGKFDLDDPVSKYIPAFEKLTLEDGQPAATTLTIRHLMTHTGGLQIHVDGDAWQARTDKSIKARAEMAAEMPLLFSPGTRNKYSSAGNNVLAGLIEVISGESYPEFMKKRLLDPLGMKDTFTVPRSEEQRQRICWIQKRENGKWIRAMRDIPDAKEDQGYMRYSTAHDLAAFWQMVLNGGVYGGQRVLSEKAVAMATSALHPIPLHKADGWDIYRGAAFQVGPTLWGVPESELPRTVKSPSRKMEEPQRFFSHGGWGGNYVFADRDGDLLGVFNTQTLPEDEPRGWRREFFLRLLRAVEEER